MHKDTKWNRTNVHAHVCILSRPFPWHVKTSWSFSHLCCLLLLLSVLEVSLSSLAVPVVPAKSWCSQSHLENQVVAVSAEWHLAAAPMCHPVPAMPVMLTLLSDRLQLVMSGSRSAKNLQFSHSGRKQHNWYRLQIHSIFKKKKILWIGS